MLVLFFSSLVDANDEPWCYLTWFFLLSDAISSCASMFHTITVDNKEIGMSLNFETFR